MCRSNWGQHIPEDVGRTLGMLATEHQNVKEVRTICEAVVKYENRTAVDLARIVLELLKVDSNV